MTYEQAISTLNLFVLSDAGATKRHAADAIDAIEDYVLLIQQRRADKECVRLGHILRHALTPEQICTAETAARAEHPEAWASRQPIAPKDSAERHADSGASVDATLFDGEVTR